MTIRDITSAIERTAPLALQESYDNCGLIIGDPGATCSGVLLTLDVTEQTVAEAIANGCNLIVAHHPLIFKGLKRLNGSTAVERAVTAAIRGNVAVYASHTAMDNANGGVSWRMARLLNLRDIEVLDPRNESCCKLSVYVPDSHLDKVRRALFDAGAGHIGNYDMCSYSSKGEGTFRPLEGASPYIGHNGSFHAEPETRLELIVPSWLQSRVENELRKIHPYEEPAYEFVSVSSGADRHSGCGVIGQLSEPLTAERFIAMVKNVFGCQTVRCTRLDNSAHATIRRVALCGGSGAFLWQRAAAMNADAFVTADIKYHDFCDAAGKILMVDAGHFETEHCITSIFYEIITEFFPNFAVRCSDTMLNPVIYM